MNYICRSCKKEVDLTKGVHYCRSMPNHGMPVSPLTVYRPRVGKGLGGSYLKKFGSRPAKKVKA